MSEGLAHEFRFVELPQKKNSKSRKDSKPFSPPSGGFWSGAQFFGHFMQLLDSDNYATQKLSLKVGSLLYCDIL